MERTSTPSGGPTGQSHPKSSRAGSSALRGHRLASWLDSLRSQLWPVPLTAIVVAVVSGQLLPYLDREIQYEVQPGIAALIFGGGPDAASNLLQTIAGAMVTVTALTFSLTVVTLQLASSQFSPRLLRTFTRDRVVHSTLGLFLATFAFALTVLRSIRSDTATSDAFVPTLSITVAFILAVSSMLALVGFLSHLARQIRVENMLKTVYAEADTVLDSIFPPDETPELALSATTFDSGPHTRFIESNSSGFLLTIDSAAVRAAAVQSGALVVFEKAVGDSLIRGVPFARARSVAGGALDDESFETLSRAVCASIAIGSERTSVQDATLGLQQLLDIASRALSPGINDATTAVHAIGYISALLCCLCQRPTGSFLERDDDGLVRVLVKRPSLEDMLTITMRQLVRYAMDDPRTAERTITMLRELAWVDSAGRLSEALELQSGKVTQALEDGPLSASETQGLLALLRG